MSGERRTDERIKPIETPWHKQHCPYCRDGRCPYCGATECAPGAGTRCCPDCSDHPRPTTTGGGSR